VLVGSKELRWEHDLRDLEPRPNPPAQTQEQVSRLFAGGRAPLTLLVEAGSPRALVLAAHRARNNLLASGADGVFGLGALLPDPARVEARRRRLRKIDAQRVIRDFRSALKRNGFKAEAYRDSMQFLRRLLRPGEPPGLDALRSYPDLAASILERDAFAAGGSLKRAISMVFVGGGAQGSESAVAQRLRASVAGVGGATLTGMPIVGADMQRMVRRELLRLMGLAAIAVGLWLLLCFRRPGAVLLMVLPTVGAFLTVGVVAGLGAVRLNPITLVIVPLVAGLGVDDGVFLVRAAVRAPRGRLIGRLRVASIAITTTSLTTGLAFASLLLTSIPAIRAMGLAMAAGIAGAWAVALFLLVPVLVVVRLGR
jgi:hypothetical protein